MSHTLPQKDPTAWLDRPILKEFPRFTVEVLLASLIILITIISRFAILGERVMSHDEVNHVVPSYSLYQGKGYAHDPVTHGPMQFHLVALSYFLFGDSDTSSRVPAALFSVATVIVVLIGFRSYLGRTGALIGGFLFMISPYMLFYGRYTRNEAFVALFGVLTLLFALRYLENGQKKYLYGLAAVTALQFATKETAFIYTAQFLLFFAVVFLQDVVTLPWRRKSLKTPFLLTTFGALVLILAAVAIGAQIARAAKTVESLSAAAPNAEALAGAAQAAPPIALEVAIVLAALVLGGLAVFCLLSGLGWKQVREVRSFDLLILVGSLILPQLTAFPIKMTGANPIDYSNPDTITRTAVFLTALAALSVLIGLVWRPRTWLISAGIFYAIFIVLYTTMFTNGRGFFTGIIGSLGYWLEQQGVNRGSQPWYYYAFLQVPMYEYLGALGTLVAFTYGMKHWLFSHLPGRSPFLQSLSAEKDASSDDVLLDAALELPPSTAPTTRGPRLPVLALLIFWSITSLVAYTLAGEKMPWLTVHIALPLLLSAGWGLGFLADQFSYSFQPEPRAWISLAVFPVFLLSLFGLLAALLGPTPPLAGKTLEELEATSRFLLSLITALVSGGVILYLLRGEAQTIFWRALGLAFFGILAVQTARVAYTASFINYDNAKEFLVYAHAARGPKDVLEQVDEISRRLTGANGIQVAYDNDNLYPYWWYFRNFPNHIYYGDKPSRELRNYPLIIVGQDNFSKLEPIVKDDYWMFETTRLWWPTQIYYDITRERIVNALSDPQMRAALFDIWLNRDYTRYMQVAGVNNLTLQNWNPSAKMRFYVKKDVIAQIWNYGAATALAAPAPDPYEGKITPSQPDFYFGMPGTQAGDLNKPRGIAAAPDGSIYVANTDNHRIEHYNASGELLQSWGGFGDAAAGAPGGLFNQPWGVAVAPDGSVYVADTWNHRIQKFTADGKFLTMWGISGQGETLDSFYGPRDVAVDRQGRVYVTDTGNKRVVVFDMTGKPISTFGGWGAELGQMDEPVGIAVDQDGKVYVADTWNQRIQVFESGDDAKTFYPVLSWEINGWVSQSLDNKPYIAVDKRGNLFIVDPEGYRVLQYSTSGAFIRGWGDYSPDPDGFGLPAGVTVGPQGEVWVTDAGNNRILRFPAAQ